MNKVAVLIPSYKPKEYFEQCLMSLENQILDKHKFTVYIALNGPKDEYEKFVFELLKKVSFEYQYIYLEQAGVSNARNKLIDLSSEEYIVFIDDDDLVSEHYLENLLSVSTDKFMAIANIYNFEKDINNLKENYIGKTFDFLDDTETSKYKIRKYFSSPVAKMIHRSMIQDIKFDEKVSRGEDSLFMAMISKNVLGIQKTNKDTNYYVYEREGSATRKKVKRSKELKTLFYLTHQYTKLFFKKDYEKLFILTRIVATLRKILKIF